MSNNRRNRKYEKPQWEVEKERLEQEKLERDARNMENTTENFPTLGKAVSRSVAWGGRKFTELASEWKAEDDDRKIIAESIKTPEDATPSVEGFVMPKFNLNKHYAEEEEEKTAPADDQTTQKEDEWTKVDHGAKARARLIRKQQRLDEKMRRMDDGEESESEHDDADGEQQDDSCWNDAPIGKSFNS